MQIVTPTEMAEIDRLTIQHYGLNSLVLMENAARGVVEHVPHGNIGILVGPGNNGGDGLVIARALKERGDPVEILFLSKSLSRDAETQRELTTAWEIPYSTYYDTEQSSHLESFLASKEVLVDALFGTGLARALEGRWQNAVERVNSTSAHRLSIDIPSGVDGSNGQILGTAIRAHQTITFGRLKRGHLLYPGRTLCGIIHLTQPGFHPSTLEKFDRVQLFDKGLASEFLPKIWPTMHKGDNGRLLLATGSMTYPGAGILSVLGALQAGAGLISHSTPPKLISSLLAWAPEAMPISRPQVPDLESFNALVVGSGLGPEAKSLGLDLMMKSALPTVIDADALFFIPDVPKERRGNFVLTPHPGELSRLMNLPVKDLENDRINAALEASASLGCTVCFKGAPTVTASPDGRAFLNDSGNPVLAQGGTGDLLAGIIGAYLSYGIPVAQAAACGCYIHGLAADLSRAKFGRKGVAAHKIAELVPIAYEESVGNQSAFTVF
jgi:ADP-dependent NAD(P)H-hydrate dehydratase / NAD(P)H-hydrate epimerase